jgi:hypothetical protein
MVPVIIKTKPITFPQLKFSPRYKIPTKKTNAGAKLINGYAFVISNLLMAAIQNNDAIKADANPEKTNGSNMSLIKATNLSRLVVSGI